MRHICEGCKDKFNEKSALLRHVSHRKSCKTHYGEIRFKQMRTEGKLVAKRKWWQNHAKEKIKSDFPKTKKSPKVLKKQNYVPQYIRKTEEGEAFTKFFNYVYIERKEAALKELQDFAYDKCYETAEDKAIDLTFETNDWLKIFNENAGPGYSWVVNKGLRELEYDEDYPFDEEFEPAFEKAFEKYLEKEIHKGMDRWLDKVDIQIYLKCKKQGENTAFTHFYEEFCSHLYTKIRDEAVDKVFDSIEEEEAMWEEKLDQTYVIIFDDLLEEASVSSDLAVKISEKLDPKIEKQVRYMKGL